MKKILRAIYAALTHSEANPWSKLFYILNQLY